MCSQPDELPACVEKRASVVIFLLMLSSTGWLTLTWTGLLFWQPADEEVKKDKEEETIQAAQEEKPAGDAARRETKEVQTSEPKAEAAPQKASRKTKTVLARVTLLDGTEYCCDLEVRRDGAGEGGGGAALMATRAVCSVWVALRVCLRPLSPGPVGQVAVCALKALAAT